MAEPSKWQPRRSTVWLVVSMCAGVVHGLFEKLGSWLSGPFYALAMVAMFYAGTNARKENHG